MSEVSAESMRKAIKEAIEKPIPGYEGCGPFHPDFVQELKDKEMHCPSCGMSARSHQ